MKNILIFGMTDTKGGMESCIMNYYRFVDSEKVHFDFLCNFDTMVYSEEVEKCGSKIYFIPKRSDDYKAYKRAVNTFFMEHSKEYDAIWFNTCSLSNIDYLKYAKRYGIKKRIVHAHNSQNMGSKLRGLLHVKNKRIIDRYATDFWSCSNEASEFFYNDRIKGRHDIILINNAIDLSKFKFDEQVRKSYRKELGIGDDALLFGHVGRFHFQKNQTFLIDIFKEIKTINNNACLIMIGKGEDLDCIKEKINDLHLDNVIIFEERSDVNCMMQAMDAFLLPSLFEGLPLVLIEAQAAGLPTYSSKGDVSNAAAVTSLMKYIPLKDGAKVWADEIMKTTLQHDRDGYIEVIGNNGYDIRREAKKLEEIIEE